MRPEDKKPQTPEEKRDAAFKCVQHAYDERTHALKLSYEFSVELCRKLFAKELATVEEIYEKDKTEDLAKKLMISEGSPVS